MEQPVCLECRRSGTIVRKKSGEDKINYDPRLGVYFKRYRCYTQGCKIRQVQGNNIIKDVIVKKEFVLSTE